MVGAIGFEPTTSRSRTEARSPESPRNSCRQPYLPPKKFLTAATRATELERRSREVAEGSQKVGMYVGSVSLTARCLLSPCYPGIVQRALNGLPVREFRLCDPLTDNQVAVWARVSSNAVTVSDCTVKRNGRDDWIRTSDPLTPSQIQRLFRRVQRVSGDAKFVEGLGFSGTRCFTRVQAQSGSFTNLLSRCYPENAARRCTPRSRLGRFETSSRPAASTLPDQEERRLS